MAQHPGRLAAPRPAETSASMPPHPPVRRGMGACLLVEGRREEARPVVAEANVLHRHVVTHVRAHALPRAMHVPDLDLGVHARRQQQVAVLWEEADRRHAFGVPRPGVDPALRQETRLVLLLPVLRRLQPRFSQRVALLLAVELGLLAAARCLVRILLASRLGLFARSLVLCGLAPPCVAPRVVPLHVVLLLVAQHLQAGPGGAGAQLRRGSLSPAPLRAAGRPADIKWTTAHLVVLQRLCPARRGSRPRRDHPCLPSVGCAESRKQVRVFALPVCGALREHCLDCGRGRGARRMTMHGRRCAWLPHQGRAQIYMDSAKRGACSQHTGGRSGRAPPA